MRRLKLAAPCDSPQRLYAVSWARQCFGCQTAQPQESANLLRCGRGSVVLVLMEARSPAYFFRCFCWPTRTLNSDCLDSANAL